MRYFVPFLFVGLLACNNKPVKTTISTFEKYPENFEGSSGCFYSLNEKDWKENRYIFVQGETEACILLNGNFVRFPDSMNMETNYYRNDRYEIEIQVHDDGMIYDSYILKGTLKVKDKNGDTLQREIFGNCGC